MSPPQTPPKQKKQEIISLDSSPEAGPSTSTSVVLSTGPPPSPLTRARAQILYHSPASRSALSPSKPHPFHQSPVHPSFLDKVKQPDFTSTRADRVREGETVVYPLHRPASPKKKVSSERVKKFRGILPSREAECEEKENVPAPVVKRVPSGSCGGASKVGNGKAAAGGCGLDEFDLKDNEWGKSPMVVYSRCKEEVDDLVGCLKGSVSSPAARVPSRDPAHAFATSRPHRPLSFDMVSRSALRSSLLDLPDLPHFSFGTLSQEWPISRRKGKENKTALIQIGDKRMILLVQISAMYYRIPPGLLRILCDANVIKLGVNIRGDALKLRRDFGHKMRGFLEVNTTKGSSSGQTPLLID